MLPGSVAKTNIGILIGILTGWLIYYEPLGTLPPIATWSIAVVGLLFHAWGCYNYVTGKGHTALLALVGLIPLGIFLSGVIPGYRAPAGSIVLIPLGLLVLAILPDLTLRSAINQRATADYHRQNSRYAPPSPSEKSRWAGVINGIVVIVVVVIGFIAYRSLRPPSVEEARRRAVQQYPALGVANSPLNREFLTRYHHYQATNQAYFNDKEWPLHLAAESQAAIDQSQAGRR